MIRTLKRLRNVNVNFSVQKNSAGKWIEFVHGNASERTFSRYLNEHEYFFLQAHKKGFVTEKDRKASVQYARKMKKERLNNPGFWTDDVAFYLDGISFIHKTNPMHAACMWPKARVWSRRGEGIKITAKGSKDLPSGQRLHVIAAIAYVVLKESFL